MTNKSSLSAEEMAIEFAEWISDNEYFRTADGFWFKTYSDTCYSSQELYEKFKHDSYDTKIQKEASSN